ncbi:hypothetical protein FM036_08320 [Nostoc sp. HG1]|nr:hypothetical protein [Nostoc sp. HG1]
MERWEERFYNNIPKVPHITISICRGDDICTHLHPNMVARAKKQKIIPNPVSGNLSMKVSRDAVLVHCVSA